MLLLLVLKKFSQNLISSTQTGFLDGRFIGESTHLMYDLMNYTDIDAN